MTLITWVAEEFASEVNMQPRTGSPHAMLVLLDEPPLLRCGTLNSSENCSSKFYKRQCRLSMTFCIFVSGGHWRRAVPMRWTSFPRHMCSMRDRYAPLSEDIKNGCFGDVWSHWEMCDGCPHQDQRFDRLCSSQGHVVVGVPQPCVLQYFCTCIHHIFWCQTQKVNKTLLFTQVSRFGQTFTLYILQIRGGILFPSITSGFQSWEANNGFQINCCSEWTLRLFSGQWSTPRKRDIFGSVLPPLRWTQNIARCQNVPKMRANCTILTQHYHHISSITQRMGGDPAVFPKCCKLRRVC